MSFRPHDCRELSDLAVCKRIESVLNMQNFHWQSGEARGFLVGSPQKTGSPHCFPCRTLPLSTFSLEAEKASKGIKYSPIGEFEDISTKNGELFLYFRAGVQGFLRVWLDLMSSIIPSE